MENFLIAKNTEEARKIGKKLSRKEILHYWEEYKRSLSDQKLTQRLLRKSFREQMLRETVEGYLGAKDHYSLTKDHIEMLLKKRKKVGKGEAYGNVISNRSN